MSRSTSASTSAGTNWVFIRSRRAITPSAVAVNIYWGVESAHDAFTRTCWRSGAKPFQEVTDVGGGIKVALVRDPLGNLFGLIENPGFQG